MKEIWVECENIVSPSGEDYKCPICLEVFGYDQTHEHYLIDRTTKEEIRLKCN